MDVFVLCAMLFLTLVCSNDHSLFWKNTNIEKCLCCWKYFRILPELKIFRVKWLYCNCLLIFSNYLVSKNFFSISDIQSFLTFLILLTNGYVNTIYLENKHFSNFCMTEILIVFTFDSNLVCHITSAFTQWIRNIGGFFFECIGFDIHTEM